MTRKEMSELFTVMALAWPSADMFKGGIQKLGPTIELWTLCTAEVDFWTGQQAVIGLCKRCKFPPTIAEFLEEAGSVTSRLRNRLHLAFNQIRFSGCLETPTEWYASLRPGDTIKTAIDAMGGPEQLELEDGSKWNYADFEAAYLEAAKREWPALACGVAVAGRGGGQ